MRIYLKPIKFFVFIIVFSGSFLMANGVEAATYYVRADGTAIDKSVAIGPVTDANATMNVATFNVQSFSDGDVIVFSSRGGSFDNVAVIIPSGSSTFDNPIVYEGEPGYEPTFDGQNTVDVIIKIASKNNLELRDMIVTRPVTSGFEIGGTSDGIVVRNATSTYSGNQAFQNLDTASTTYYNLYSTGNADDAFSMHGTTTAYIDGAVFEHSDQVINYIQAATIHADNITLRYCGEACIYPTNSYGTNATPTGVFNNVLVENPVGSTTEAVGAGYGVVLELGQNSTTTINNITVRNLPSTIISAVVIAINNASLNMTNFNFQGNPSASVLTEAILAKNDVVGKGNSMYLSNGVISGFSNHAIDSYLDHLFINNLLIKDLNSAKYGIVIRGGNASIKNVSIFDSDKNASGIFVTGASSVINVINSVVNNVATAFLNSSPLAPVANVDHSTNYGNTTASSGTWSVTNAVNDNPRFVSTSTENFQLVSTSTLIDAGTTTGYDYDLIGNPIYGTPDIGAYEYQPPFTLGTDKIDPTGNIRIYGDKKYRYTTATSSTMLANFSVSPAEGSWTYSASSSRPEWLNISNITWNTSGSYSKQWTASSSIATTTVYMIGDMRPNTPYIISVDGTQDTTATSDSSGILSYTYTGGYSTHTFAANPDTTAPTVSFDSPTVDSTITSSITLSATASDNIAISSVQFKLDGVTDIGSAVTSPTSGNTYTTIWDPTGVSNMSHTLFAVAKDSSGNYATSTVVVNVENPIQTSTISSGSNGMIFTGTISSLPNYIQPRPTTIYPDGTIVYGNATTTSNDSNSQPNQTSIISTPITNYSTQHLTPFSYHFVRDLQLWNRGEDVRQLQIFLNTNGFALTDTGYGAPGNETSTFGYLTLKALVKFQKANNITPAYGYFGPITRGYISEL